MDIQKLSGVTVDEYRLDHLLGQGGMSAVYKARQEELERDVAIKILSDKLAQDPGYVERFRREAKMAASLEHPHIVPVYDFGEQNDMTFVVMRLLRGGDLSQRLDGKPMNLSVVGVIVDAVAQALDYAHSRGIVHRDVKPTNIMFDDRGLCYLVDFGIAKATQQNDDMGLTAANIVLGTPPYMAPEQWRGSSPTPAVDQYALAVVTYRMVTGEPPFLASSRNEMMFKHMNEKPTAPHQVNPNLPEAVSAVLLRSLAKDPASRYPSLSAFSDDFERAVRGESLSSMENTMESAVSFIESDDTSTPIDMTVKHIPVAPTPTPAADETMETPAVRLKDSDEGIKAPVSPSPQQVPSQQPAPHIAPSPRSASPPPPSKQSEQMGERTLMQRMAVGGGIGLIIVLILAIIGGFVLFGVVLPILTPDSTATPVASATLTPDINVPTITAVVTNLPDIGSATVTPLPQPPTTEPPLQPPVVIVFNQPEVPVRDVAFYPNNNRLVSVHGDGAVRVWFNGPEGQPTEIGRHNDVVYTVAINNIATLIATGSADGTIQIWDANSGLQVRNLVAHPGGVRDLDFSNDGRFLVSGGEDNEVKVWNLETFELFKVLSGHQNRVLAVAISPDSQTIASGGEEPNVFLWDAVSGVKTMELQGHAEAIRSLDFSNDGLLLASSSTDDSIRVWDRITNQAKYVLTNHGRDVWRVGFNATSNLLASGGRDNNLRVWNMADGSELVNLTGHAGWVFGMGFSADSSQIVSASGDGTVRLWRIP